MDIDFLQSFSLETVAIIALFAGFLGYVGGTIVSKPSQASAKILHHAETQTDFLGAVPFVEGSSPSNIIGSGVSTSPELSVDGSLNITGRPQFEDAMSYLELLKRSFSDKPHVYAEFLDLLQSFRDQKIDTFDIVREVSKMFEGHPKLVDGFNIFLPPGYKIDDVRAAAALRERVQKRQQEKLDAEKSTTGTTGATATTTPSTKDTPTLVPEFKMSSATQPKVPTESKSGKKKDLKPPSVQQTVDQLKPLNEPAQTAETTKPKEKEGKKADAVAGLQPKPNVPGYDKALDYVKAVQTRFASNQPAFVQFLDLLRQLEGKEAPMEEIVAQVKDLFRSDTDLLTGFSMFLPPGSSLSQSGSCSPVLGAVPLEKKKSKKKKNKSKKK